MTDIHESQDSGPNEHPNARPITFRQVSGARVVKIPNAFFRGSKFPGVFELADDALCYYGKTPRLKVFITWFRWKPKVGYCEITPLSAVEFDADYYGEVVDNVGLE